MHPDSVCRPDPNVSAGPAPAPPPAPPLRRGWLRHGNRPGDYAKAPRCGARTRAGGCCRQPAMANGRCRMHGGLSTGPRTEAGLARARRARWKHGFDSAEIRNLRSAASHAGRNLAFLVRLAKEVFGPSRRPVRRSLGKGGPSRPAAAAARPSSGAPAGSEILAGHGVHRTDSTFTPPAAGRSAGNPPRRRQGQGGQESKQGKGIDRG
jgi:hypothetical protein